MRLLAKRVELSPSYVSRLLSGKKALPADLIPRFAKVLDIDLETVSHLKKMRASVPAAPPGEPSETQDWKLVDLKAYKILTKWYYLPLLELTTTRSFDGSLEMICDRLDLARSTAEVAVRELTSLGLLKQQGGRLMKTTQKLRWTSSISKAEIRAFHSHMLSKAREVLLQETSDTDRARRLITGITVTADPKDIEEAKRKLNECLHSIANDLLQSEGEDVYHLAAQLFPLTTEI